MARLMDYIRHVLGFRKHMPPSLTTEEEKERIRERLADQRIRFARMGIAVDNRRAGAAAAITNHPRRRQGERR